MNPGARLVILGKQGAGKGTQAVRLSRHYVVPHVATGDIFRAAVRSGSEFGQKARQYLDAGELVPDEIVIGMVRERLTHDDTTHRGFILDGFPRTAHQAEALMDILEPQGLDLAVNLEIDTEHVLRRLAARRVCSDCGANYSVVDNPPRVRRHLRRVRRRGRPARRRHRVGHPAAAGALRAGDGAAHRLVPAARPAGQRRRPGQPRRGHRPARRRGRPAQARAASRRIRAAAEAQSRAGPAHHLPPASAGSLDGATQRGRNRQDAQGRAGGGRDARRHPGRGPPRRDHRRARPGGPRGPRPAGRPVQLPQLPRLSRR